MYRSSPARLVALSSAVVDYIYQIDQFPHAGEEETARGFMRAVGGGFNMMAAAARSGLPVAFAGIHGCGEHGVLLRQTLQQEGIAILSHPHETMDNGHCLVFVTDDGERSFISAPGAEAHFDPTLLENVVLVPHDWLFASGYALVYPECAKTLIRWIAQYGGTSPLIFDPAPIVEDIPPDVLQHILQRSHWLSCNDKEAMVIAGSGTIDKMAARLLYEHCPQAAGVVVRAGRHGCYFLTREGENAHIPAFSVEAIDTNGAGDTHIGAFIAAMLMGKKTKEALYYANAAAAISVTRRGGSMAPTRHEINAFMQQHIGVN